MRPAPEEGETLLSWMTRLAVENGLELKDFLSEMLRRSRPHPERGIVPASPVRHLDLTTDDALLSTLADAALVPPDEVLALTEARHRLNVFPAFLLLSLPSRRLEAEVALTRQPQGRFLQAFCPECLSAGFCLRRLWNLAFVCVCPTHRRLLLEECPRCGDDLDFTDAGHQRWRREQPPGTLPCRHCRFDLVRAKRQSGALPITDDLMRLLNGLIRLAETSPDVHPLGLPLGRGNDAEQRRLTLRAFWVLVALIQNPARYFGWNGTPPQELADRRLHLYRRRAMNGLGLRTFDPAWEEPFYKRLSCEVRHILLEMACWLILDRHRTVWNPDKLEGSSQAPHFDGELRLQDLASMVWSERADHPGTSAKLRA